MSQSGFKGDVSAREAWDALVEAGQAVLLDVRSAAEWAFVGGPDLVSLGKEVIKIEWQRFPGMLPNEDFVDEFLALGIDKENPVYIICRSGVRSRFAAIELATQGYATYNVADGFEGQLGPEGHRGLGGWRALGLPWRQG